MAEVVNSTKQFKVVADKTTRLKHDGIADDFIEASVNGKEIQKPYRKKSLYKKTDSVEEMESSTVDLLSDTSRKVIKTMEERENERLNELIEATYYPTAKRECENEEDLLRRIINIV